MPLLVQDASGEITSGTSLTVTLGAGTTAGNCLVDAVGASQATTNPTVSGVTLGGSSTNAVDAKSVNNNADTDAEIWIIWDIAGGQTSVVTSFTAGSGSIQGNAATVMEWSGVQNTSNPVDKTAGNTGASASPSSGATTTLSQASELAIGVVSQSGGSGDTITGPSSPWTNLAQENASTGVGIMAGYQVVSSTAAVTYSVTLASSAAWAAVVATLLAAGGAATAVPGLRGPAGPARAARRRGGWTAGSPGGLARNPAGGPVFRQAPVPARSRVPQAAPRGRVTSNPGGPVVNPVAGVGPVFYPARQAARIRPSMPPRGRTSGSPGAPVRNPVQGPAARQAPVPARSRVPQAAPRGRVASNPGTPVTQPPASVVNQWAVSTAQPSALQNMPPALQSSVIALNSSTSVGGGTGTPTEGNWLFCLAGWNQDGLTAATVGDSDDIHSFWRPGNVWTSDWAVSTASANTRTSIWYTPNIARAAQDVYCAPNGLMAGMAVLVIEVSGLGPWDTVTGIYTSYAAAAESLGLSLAAPSAQAFLVAACCGDSDAVSQSLAPAGWTALSTVTATNGTDHTCDAVLTSACVITSGSVSVSATTSGASDLSGAIIGVLASAPSPIPATANPGWAGRTVLEFAPGGGFETPPDELTWVALSDSAWTSQAQGFKRLWSWADKASIPYGLGQFQSGSGAAQLDNYDGNLSPSNPGSTWYSTALNANMSFQSGVSPWTASNGAALTQSGTYAYASSQAASALYSLEVTPNGSTALPGAVSEEDTVTAGSAYSGSAWFYSAAGWATGAEVAIRWLNSSGGTISTSASSATAIPAGTWTQVTLLDQTAPGGAVGAELIVQFAGTPAASAPFWVAEAALAAGASAVTTGLLTAGVPIRLRLALGTYGGTAYNRWYAIGRNANSWPEKRTTKSYRGYVETGLTDIWSVGSGTCPTPYRAEVELDDPYAWWPMDDQALQGGVLPTTLRNAATGNTHTLAITAAPGGVSSQDAYSSAYGDAGGGAGTDLTAITTTANPAVASYGVGQMSGWMYGDPQVAPQSAQTGNPVTAQPGSSAWAQAGEQGDTGSHGWVLIVNDTGFPALSGGVTVEGWFNYAFAGTPTGIDNEGTFYNVAGQPYCALTLFELATSSNPVCVLQLDINGHLDLITYNGSTGTSHTIYSSSDLRCNAWFKVSVLLTTTTWTVKVNGGLTANVSGTATGMTSAWTWLVINGDLGSDGGSTAGTGLVHGGNVAVSHVAVYPRQLPQWRELAHYWAAIAGFGMIPAPSSVTAQAVRNEQPTGFTPDGSEYQGSYGSGGNPYTFSCLAAAVAGSYTSGPGARSTIGGQGLDTPSAYGAACWAGWTALAPLVQVFTSASAATETEAASCLGSGDSFTSGYGSGASGHGASQVSGGTGASPPTAATPVGDTAGQRIERILGYGGITWPGRSIDPASLLVQAAIDVGGAATGANIQHIADSDSGWLFTDGPGNLCYRQRSHLNADPVVWQLGPDTAAGQLPYAVNVAFRNDQQRVYTAITINPYSPDGASLADIVPASATAVAAAQAQYGVRPLAITSYLQSSTENQSHANWALAYYGTMRRGVETVTVDAATYPAAWPMVAGASLSDLVQVTDQPFSAPVTSGTYRISGLSRQIAYGANGQAPTARLQMVLDPVYPGGLWT